MNQSRTTTDENPPFILHPSSFILLNHAAIIGRSHRLIQQNCHDFACTGSLQPGSAFGLVLDGCGSKYRESKRVTHSHNEVGAKLLGQFTAEFLRCRLSVINDQSASLETILDDLYQESLTFLNTLLSLFPFADDAARTRFVASRLLCTLVGFVTTSETAVFFWSGDGYLCRDGQITRLESDNRPEYLAYQLLPDRRPPTVDSGRFQMEWVDNFDEISWLAVATDGWQPELLAKLAAPRSNLALQRWLNVQARQRGHFEDDGAVAAWWRVGIGD